MGQFVRLARRQTESNGAARAIGDHASLCPEPATRPAKRFTSISLVLRSPFRVAPTAFW